MKRFLIRLAALLLSAILLPLVACVKSGQSAVKGLTKAEEERITELARTFRVFGEYDVSKGFGLNQYEYMVYSLFTWSLPECEKRGYGSVGFDEADRAFSSVIEDIDTGGILKTKYDPSEIQVIYALNDRYYVLRTDDSAFTYTVTSADVLKSDSGERTGVRATVDISGPEGVFCLAFELADGKNGLSVRKCELQSYE